MSSAFHTLFLFIVLQNKTEKTGLPGGVHQDNRLPCRDYNGPGTWFGASTRRPPATVFLVISEGGFQEGRLSEEGVIPAEPDVVACIDAQ